MSRWREIHALNEKRETVAILSKDATDEEYLKICNTPSNYYCISYLSYKYKNGEKLYYVIDARFK